MSPRNLRLIFDPLFRFAEANAKVALSGNGDQRNVLVLSVQNLLKKSMLLLVALFIFTSVTLMAQSPQKINFQSIVRNTSGVIFSNKTLSFKISILSGSITGTQVYSETHSSTTDAIGLVSLQIGSGTALSGSFAAINWENATHFIKLEADFTGGNNYVLLGTKELMSVPYAMYASKTDTMILP
jgi:preprotein translocase subunit SecG